jgi:hypothetical protein
MADTTDNRYGPEVLDRAGIALKVAALAFLELMQEPGVDPILYAPGVEIRLTRMDTTGRHDR